MFCNIKSGIPKIKYHLRVLCLKINIPKYTPILPKIVAIKNNIPSEILTLSPFFFEMFLSNNINKKAVKFRTTKTPTIRKILENIFYFYLSFFKV